MFIVNMFSFYELLLLCFPKFKTIILNNLLVKVNNVQYAER